MAGLTLRATLLLLLPILVCWIGIEIDVDAKRTFRPKHHAVQFPELLTATQEELATGLAKGEFTSVDLVNAYTARIREVNGTLRAVVELNPDALAIAERMDAERRFGRVRGPLHGLPMIIKNNIATADEMNNTAGSFALLGAKVPKDSHMARQLRTAGVVLLGKSNLSQWANFRSSNSSNGWSAYGGQVTGAYIVNQDPSGSSSGSGAGTSVGLAWAALGSETDGSILSPSDVNNLVGIKPTVGLTSRALVIPISEHQDTVGPMAKTVLDAAHILSVIAGKDPDDNYTSAIPFRRIPDYTKSCTLSALRGARIGIPRNAISTDSSLAPVLTAFANALQTITSAGATIIDNTNLTAFAAFERSNNESIVLDSDFINDLAHYLSQLTVNPNNITSLADLARFTEAFPAEDFPDRNIAEWQTALALGFDNTSPQAFAARQADLFLGGEGGVLGAMDRFRLDAMVIPTMMAPGLIAITGSPGVSVPLGAFPNGTRREVSSRGLVEAGPNLPFGLSFIGRPFSEQKLVGFAYAFEQRTKVRNTITPVVLPTTELVDVV